MAPPVLPHKVTLGLQETRFPGDALVADSASAVDLSLSPVAGEGARYTLSGSGSKSVDFSAIPAAGAKLLLLIYESGASPISLALGGGTIELTQGGFVCIANPSPTSGVASLSVTHTADAILRVKLLG